MSRGEPKGDCVDMLFGSSYAIPDPAEVALEDYARAFTRARAAEAIRGGDDDAVTGVHLCGLPVQTAPAAKAEIEAFARELRDHGGNGLGWS
jgi:hypothetical protein